MGLSLAGDSLPVRLRSTAIGLVGLVAALGLGFVAMVFQQGWPSVSNAPLPQAPGPELVHNDTIAETLADPIRRTDARRGHPHVVKSRRQVAMPAPESPQLGGAHRVEPPVADPDPVAPPPEPPAPEGQPPPPAPSPVTSPTPEPVASQPASEGSSEPVAAGLEDDSPGNSDEAPGPSQGAGPPPWVAAGNGATSGGHHGHGKPAWAGH